MKLLTRKYNIKANIERVFYCFSDTDYILQEIKRLNKNNKIKVVKKDQMLEFKGKSTLFRLKKLEVKEPFLYRAQIIPIDNTLLKFGNATLTCKFGENSGETDVQVEMHSEKNPKLLWKVYIKIIIYILMLQSRSDEKRYIKKIEQCY